MKAHISNLSKSTVLFGLSVFTPSIALVQKYLGLAGVGSYLVAASLALFMFVRNRRAIARLVSKVNGRQVMWLTWLTLLTLGTLFAVVLPIANSGIVGGSDSDDALNLATTQLLHGHYPYYLRTYLGNEISPLPGALFLAIPFVLCGNSAYQNVFWVVVFAFAMRSHLEDPRSALLLLWVIFSLSPVAMYLLVVGNDYLANSLYVLLFVLWTTAAISQSGRGGWRRVIFSILLGVALSSRANFTLLLPIAFFASVRSAGWAPAIKYIGITFMTFLVVTLPFYLYDPHGFSPLHTRDKLGQFDSIVPGVGLAVPVLTGCLAVILALRQSASLDLNALLGRCAIVLAFPVVCGEALTMLKSGWSYSDFGVFGVFFLFFGAVSVWGDVFEYPLSEA